jgi:hypothetical protein
MLVSSGRSDEAQSYAICFASAENRDAGEKREREEFREAKFLCFSSRNGNLHRDFITTQDISDETNDSAFVSLLTQNQQCWAIEAQLIDECWRNADGDTERKQVPSSGDDRDLF